MVSVLLPFTFDMFEMNNPVKLLYKSMKSIMFIIKTNPQKE